MLQPVWPRAEDLIFGTRLVDITASYSMSPTGVSSVFGYVGLPGEPALGPPVSTMRHYAGIDDPEAAHRSHWLDAQDGSLSVVTVGYTWRDLSIERSAFSRKKQDKKPRRVGDSLRLDSRSVRLSFSPSPSWILQISRGSLSGLDQLLPNADVRRTSISATYSQDFKGGNWQTTLAWGRNSRKIHETTMGYLLESTLRFDGTHVVFGRVEQVGSDELARENELQHAQMFKMNKVTIGYFHDMRTGGPIKIDVGVLASRYLVPSAMTSPYGNDPSAYMMFLRLKLQ